MTRDPFESEIEAICTQNTSWHKLFIDYKFRDNNSLITDHDVIMYQMNEDRIIICEIQCKDEDSSSFSFKKDSAKPSRFGYFGFNDSKRTVFSKEIESTKFEAFTDWRYGKNEQPMIDRLDKNPLTQLYCSVIDTINQLRPKGGHQASTHLSKFDGKEIMVFPIIVYKNLSSSVYPLRLHFTKKFIDKMKNSVSVNFDSELSERDLDFEFPLLLVSKEYLKNSDLLHQLESYLTQKFEHSDSSK